MRTAARKDANHQQIVKWLRQVGATVEVLNQKGLPDLLVGFRGTNYLIEVKTARGRITAPQNAFLRTWGGMAYIARNPLDALAILGVRLPDDPRVAGGAGVRRPT